MTTEENFSEPTSNKDCGIGSGGECMTCGSDNKCW